MACAFAVFRPKLQIHPSTYRYAVGGQLDQSGYPVPPGVFGQALVDGEPRGDEHAVGVCVQPPSPSPHHLYSPGGPGPRRYRPIVRLLCQSLDPRSLLGRVVPPIAFGICCQFIRTVLSNAFVERLVDERISE